MKDYILETCFCNRALSVVVKPGFVVLSSGMLLFTEWRDQLSQSHLQAGTDDGAS